MAAAPITTTVAGEDNVFKFAIGSTSNLKGVDSLITAQDDVVRMARPYDGLEMSATTVIEHPDKDRRHKESCKYFLYHLFRGQRNRDWRNQTVFDDDEVDQDANTKSTLPRSTAGKMVSDMKSSFRRGDNDMVVIINEEEMVDMIG